MKLTELSDAVEASHRALAAIINGDVEPFLSRCTPMPRTSQLATRSVRSLSAVTARVSGGRRAAGNYSDGEIVGFDPVATHVNRRVGVPPTGAILREARRRARAPCP